MPHDPSSGHVTQYSSGTGLSSGSAHAKTSSTHARNVRAPDMPLRKAGNHACGRRHQQAGSATGIAEGLAVVGCRPKPLKLIPPVADGQHASLVRTRMRPDQERAVHSWPGFRTPGDTHVRYRLVILAAVDALVCDAARRSWRAAWRNWYTTPA
jgi:hypothetical protein